ncbi:MAG: glycerol kinase GlpK [bacterium]
MGERFILAIDQGTTGTRAIAYDRHAHVLSQSYRQITQYYPRPGWVEHDPEEIWQSCLSVVEETLTKSGLKTTEIEAIGITNQRETTLIWDRNTGEPQHKAIVWQCRRTTPRCHELILKGLEELVKERTGLVIDPYFSATKIGWILDNVPGTRERAEKGEIVFGTVDSWLLWKLTGGVSHLTEYTNASRTMLFNIHKLDWDPGLLDLFQIPRRILPLTRPSGSIFGYTAKNGPLCSGIPIAAVLGDQQAALFGQMGFYPGMAKNTYGTGCFLLLNLGKKSTAPSKGLLATLACDGEGKPVHALEGSVFTAGAAVQWLRDELGLIRDPKDTEKAAVSVEDTGGVYMIPAFTGLGAPYWDSSARGAILGISRGTRKEHIIRATLESIAYQTRDVLEIMEASAKLRLEKLRVDGGAAKNDFLMQFQSDILGIPVERPMVLETTALGAALLAGLTTGFWRNKEELNHLWKRGASFMPKMASDRRKILYAGWKKAVSRVLSKEA